MRDLFFFNDTATTEIYTLGIQPGTHIRRNLIHDITSSHYGGWAIYPDEGSAHLVIEENICYNTSQQPFHQHYGRENTVRNNIFAFGGQGVCCMSQRRQHDRGYAHPGENSQSSGTFIHNILLASSDTWFFIEGYGFDFRSRDLRSDMNLFWRADGAEPISGRLPAKGKKPEAKNSIKWKEWRKLGYDLCSVVADPKFKNPGKGDFTLAKDSPARKIGFRPFDLSGVGPRPKSKRALD